MFLEKLGLLYGTGGKPMYCSMSIVESDCIRTFTVGVAATCAIVFAPFARAAEVTPERAFNAVDVWVARGPAPSRAPTGEVKTFSLCGTNAFHFVALSGGGFAVVPCDDANSPILGFADEADFADMGDRSAGAMSNMVLQPLSPRRYIL